MDLDLDIHNIFSLLKDSYKNIDFRTAIYKTNKNWNRILTIIRFSKENELTIKNKHDELELTSYKTNNFKIHHEIANVSSWENFLIQIYDEINEEIEIYDFDDFLYNDQKFNQYQESFLGNFKSLHSNPRIRFFFTEDEIGNYNIFNFIYSVSDKNNHHLKFDKILKNEILSLGEDNIYEIINRTMELDGYGSQNALFISLVFPIYLKISNLSYSNEILSGKIEFHEIYEGTKFFFRIFSNPNFNASLKGRKVITISKDSQGIRKKDNESYEIDFNLDFSEFNCDPIFEIRALWNKIPILHLIDFRHTFETPRFNKIYANMIEEITIEDNEEPNLYLNDIIDLDIFHSEFYREQVEEINRAYRKGFFTCTYILIRKFIENLLIDCLRDYYTEQNLSRYFNVDKKKFLSLSKLRLTFNEMINNPKFIARVDKIQQQVVDFLDIFKEIGDSSAHSFFSINHQELIEQNRAKLLIVIRQLAKIKWKLNQQTK